MKKLNIGQPIYYTNKKGTIPAIVVGYTKNNRLKIKEGDKYYFVNPQNVKFQENNFDKFYTDNCFRDIREFDGFKIWLKNNNIPLKFIDGVKLFEILDNGIKELDKTFDYHDYPLYIPNIENQPIHSISFSIAFNNWCEYESQKVKRLKNEKIKRRERELYRELGI